MVHFFVVRELSLDIVQFRALFTEGSPWRRVLACAQLGLCELVHSEQESFGGEQIFTVDPQLVFVSHQSLVNIVNGFNKRVFYEGKYILRLF